MLRIVPSQAGGQRGMWKYLFSNFKTILRSTSYTTPLTAGVMLYKGYIQLYLYTLSSFPPDPTNFLSSPIVYCFFIVGLLTWATLITNSQLGSPPCPCSCGRAWPPLSSQTGGPASAAQAGRARNHCRACSHYLLINLWTDEWKYTESSHHCTWYCCWSSGPEAEMWKCLD